MLSISRNPKTLKLHFQPGVYSCIVTVMITYTPILHQGLLTEYNFVSVRGVVPTGHDSVYRAGLPYFRISRTVNPMFGRPHPSPISTFFFVLASDT